MAGTGSTVVLSIKGARTQGGVGKQAGGTGGLREGSSRIRQVIWQLSVGPLGRKKIRMKGVVAQPLMAGEVGWDDTAPGLAYIREAGVCSGLHTEGSRREKQ